MEEDGKLCKRESRRKRKCSEKGEEEAAPDWDEVDKASSRRYALRELKRKSVLEQNEDEEVFTDRKNRARTQMPDYCKQRKMDNKYFEEISENCHQCQRHDKGGVIKCKNCRRKRYRFPCAKNWYPHSSKDDIEKKCPLYCNCKCKACLRFTKIDHYKELIKQHQYSIDEKEALCHCDVM